MTTPAPEGPVTVLGPCRNDGSPLRICDACGVVDDYPRHQHDAGPQTAPLHAANVRKVAQATDLTDTQKDSILAGILDHTTVQLHHVCCRAQGCPDGTCDLIPATITDVAEVTSHIESGALTADHEALVAQQEAVAQAELAAAAGGPTAQEG